MQYTLLLISKKITNKFDLIVFEMQSFPSGPPLRGDKEAAPIDPRNN
jgi:hypothetical protein